MENGPGQGPVSSSLSPPPSWGEKGAAASGGTAERLHKSTRSSLQEADLSTGSSIATRLQLVPSSETQKVQLHTPQLHPARHVLPCLKLQELRTFLVVQWLGLHAPSAGDPGLFPSQGIRSHMPQQKSKIPTETRDSQINKI